MRFLIILLLTINIAQAQIARPSENFLPAGAIMAFALEKCPTGWLEANGDQKSRTEYKRLFASMGTIHGSGNGTSTFHLPDYRGRFLRMVDGSAGNDPDKETRTAMNTGGATGNKVGSVQLDEIKSHNHGWTGPTLRNQQNAGDDGYWHTYQGWQGSVASLTGSTGGSETRVKNAYVIYCVKY